jgi:hypothetical protein
VKTAVKAIRFLSFPALLALVLGSVVVMPQVAVSSTTPATNTNLGAVRIDCGTTTRDGQTVPGLVPRQIGFTGGSGDYFFIYSNDSDCQINDSDNVISGPGITEGDGAVWDELPEDTIEKVTILKEGTFQVRDKRTPQTTVTFTVIAHPVFPNPVVSKTFTVVVDANATATPTVSLHCGADTGELDDTTIFVNNVNDSFTLANTSTGSYCDITPGTANLTGLPTFLGWAPRSNATSGSIQVLGAGVFAVSSSDALDLEPEAEAGTEIEYDNVFVSGGARVNAIVTFTEANNLDASLIDYIDENENLSGINWGIAPQLDSGSGDGRGSATLEVAFEGTGGEPLALSGLSVTVVDIDYEQAVSANNVVSYELSSEPETDLSAVQSGSNVTVTSPTGGSEDYDEAHWVVMNLLPASTYTFTVSVPSGGNGSFVLLFSPTEWNEPPATTFIATPSSASEETLPRNSSDSDEPVPAIALDLQATVGAPTSQASAFIEGQGLQVGSPYTLRLGPTGRVLYEGIVPSSGRFDHLGGLPANLAPGQYVLELRAIGEDGSSLFLTQVFTVGAGGVITSVSASQPSGAASAGLANTGVDQSMMALWMGAMALVALGMTSVAVSRRSRRDTSPV